MKDYRKCTALLGPLQVCPAIFTQIFTIHGIFRGEAFPFAYSLLPNKTQASYTTVFDVIVEKCRDLRLEAPRPDTVIADFEQPTLSAVTTVFPDTILRLCLFHLGQSVYRHVQAQGLQVAYAEPEDREIKIHVHMMISIAFVPTDDVEAAFDEVIEHETDSRSTFSLFQGGKSVLQSRR